jgi:hypothetical protein
MLLAVGSHSHKGTECGVYDYYYYYYLFKLQMGFYPVAVVLQ